MCTTVWMRMTARDSGGILYNACHAGSSILSHHRAGLRVGYPLCIDDGGVVSKVRLHAEQGRSRAPRWQQGIPFGDEGLQKNFLPALGRQGNDGDCANGDIFYRAQSGHSFNSRRGYQATFCFQHPLSPSTDQRGMPASPCFHRT
jgi:hypothetical protein